MILPVDALVLLTSILSSAIVSTSLTILLGRRRPAPKHARTGNPLGDPGYTHTGVHIRVTDNMGYPVVDLDSDVLASIAEQSTEHTYVAYLIRDNDLGVAYAEIPVNNPSPSVYLFRIQVTRKSIVDKS